MPLLTISQPVGQLRERVAEMRRAECVEW
jgi:hypothetical protein